MAKRKGKYVAQITAEAKGGIAYIRIVDVISEWGESSSFNVREKIDQFIRDGITSGRLYVNSRGGDCFEATEIDNEFSRFSDTAISVGAVAASAATYLVARHKTSANSTSQFMIHRPRLGTYGDLVTINNDIKLLENTTNLYKAAYAKKTGKTEEEIEELWSKGDIWLTAQEALELGLIDSIEEDDEETVITAEDVALLEACGAPVIPEAPKPIVDNKNKNTMDRNLLIAALGLSADATDADIQTAIKNNKEKADLQAKAETDGKAKIKEDAVKDVDAALGVKKIKAEQRDFYINAYLGDPKGTKAALDAIPEVPKLSALIDTTIVDLTAKADWTYDDWMDKDPKGLEALATTQPDEFNKLIKKP